jgi:hypothetical protein
VHVAGGNDGNGDGGGWDESGGRVGDGNSNVGAADGAADGISAGAVADGGGVMTAAGAAQPATSAANRIVARRLTGRG